MRKYYPLTSAQKVIYNDMQLTGNESKYNMGGAILIFGKIDPDSFEKAYQKILLKFDAYRIKFELIQGEVQQYFSSHKEYKITNHDYRSDLQGYHNAIQDMYNKLLKPTNIFQDQLFGEELYFISDDLTIWFSRFHHLINDGYGHGSLSKQFVEEYNALENNLTTTSVEFVSYKDFIESDLQYLNSDKYIKSKKFWLDRLSNYNSEFFNNNRQNFATEQLTLKLSRIFYNSIEKIAEHYEVTTFQFLLGIFYIILFRLYKRNEIVISVPVLNRKNKAFRSIPGLFMGMTPIIQQLEGNLTVESVVKEIHKELRSCYRHQQFPFNEIIKELRKVNPQAINLLNFSLVYRNSDYTKYFNNAPMKTITFDTASRHEFISIEIDEYNKNQDVNFFFNFRTAVFDKKQMETFTKAFEASLLDVIFSPEKKIKDLNIIPLEEKNKIITHKSGVTTYQTTILNLVEKQFENNAQNIAIITENGSITYSELEKQVTIIASNIIKKIGTKNVVAVQLPRDYRTIMLILAIWKSKNTYLPIPIDTPTKRFDFMINQADVKLLISETNSAKNILHSSYKNLLDRDNELTLPNLYPEDNAYIIFTSGTTGTPKAVLLKHQGFSDMIMSQINHFGILSSDCIGQFASFAFDASLSEIFMGLGAGASIYIIPENIKKDLIKMNEVIHDKNISVLTLPPAYLSSFKQKLTPSRVLITAGESPSLEDVNYYKNICDYYNAYGPTETSVCATIYRVDKNKNYQSVPIGKTIENCAAFILDKNLNLVPLGFTGELFIESSGLASSYLKQETLTQEKFVLNPHTGNRMYRTGDLCRWNENDNLEFQGRVDEQKKIRGFRIEPEEIKHQIMLNGNVKNAFVTIKDCGPKASLIAYIIPGENWDKNITEAEIAKFLPSYMIPQHWILLNSFPLTANGKINIKELPIPEIETKIYEERSLSDKEKKIAIIWKKVLVVEDIFLSSNFFHLGGHSLTAMELKAEIESETEYTTSFDMIFRFPTFKEFTTKLIEKNNANSIISHKIQESYIPSQDQKRFWMLSRIDNTSSYNMPIILDLNGKINVNKLKESIQLVVAQEPILRSFFIEKQDLIMKIEQQLPLDIKIIDVSEWINQEVDQWFLDFSQQVFDLQKAPLFRIAILKKGKNLHKLCVVMHHIIGDGQSLKLFFNRIQKVYEGEKYQNELDYFDYLKTGKSIDSYPMQRLQNINPLKYKTDINRPAVKSFRGNFICENLSSELNKKIVKLSTDLEVSPFSIFTSAFAVLLYKKSFQKDFSIGFPVDLRTTKATQNMLGLFLNTIPLPIHLMNCTNKELIQEMQSSILDSLALKEIPFDQIIKQYNPEKTLNRHPIFDFFIQFQPKEMLAFNIDNAIITQTDFSYFWSKFDLSITIKEIAPVQFKAYFNYATDIFSKDTITNWFREWLAILNQFEKTYNNWNDISLISNKNQEIITKFEAGNKNSPSLTFSKKIRSLSANQQVALIDVQEEITYQEMMIKISSLASYCYENANSNDFIGIQLDRSLLTIISMLGIYFGNGTFIPINDTLPEKRIERLVKQTNMKFLITMKKYNFVTCIHPDHIQENVLELREKNKIMYAIATSGTTGNPKVALIRDYNINNLIEHWQRYYNNIERVGVLAPFSFDASIKQIFPAILLHKTLIIVPNEARYDPRKLYEYITKKRIQCIDATPIHLQTMLDFPYDEHSSLAKVFVGGEKLSANLANQWLQKFPTIELYNVYGPTECSDVVTIHKIDEEIQTRIVSIGKPIDNICIKIVNPDLQEVDILDEGEILIGGEAVGAGYLNNQTLTEKSFITLLNKTWYRTSDLGFFDNQGNIHITGRKDSQLKINGYRIEKDEIIEVLLKNENIDFATIINDNQKIIAFIISNKELSQQSLSKHCSLYLPDYMIPHQFITIPELPMTFNGKINEQKLISIIKDMEHPIEIEPESFNITERKIQAAFSEILQQSILNKNSSFFMLGGNSLSGIKLINYIQKHLNMKISMNELFANPTITSLAKICRTKEPLQFSEIPKILEKEFYDVSGAQRRLWFLSKMESSAGSYNVPGTLEFVGNVDIRILEKSFNDLIKSYEILRTTFIEIEGKPYQKIHKPYEFKINELAYSSDRTDDDIRAFALEDAQLQFDIEKLPLFRASIIQRSDNSFVLVFNMHHIIGDGWSLGVLINKLSLCYQGYLTNNTVDITPTIQYKDFSAWQNDKFGQIEMEKQKLFWTEQYKTPIDVIQLYPDFQRPPIKTYNGDVETLIFSKELSAAINNLGNENNATLFMVLLSSVVVLLNKYSDQNEFGIGMPVAARRHDDLKDQIGFFINTLPLRIGCNPNQTWLNHLWNIRDYITNVYENQDYPFEELVKHLKLPQDTSRNPLFDIMLLVQNNERGVWKLPDIDVKPFYQNYKSSKFDLQFTFEEIEGKIHFDLEYNTDLFLATRIKRIMSHLELLLLNISQNPSLPIQKYNIIGKDELNIIENLNNTNSVYDHNASIGNLLDSSFDKNRNKIALQHKKCKVSYENLYLKSKTISNHLDKLSLKRIAIILNPSEKLITAILGSIFAGICYVPIDPMYPVERRNLIMKDAEIDAIITSKEFHSSDTVPSFDIDDLLALPQTPFTKKVDPSTPAYMIYTSGSTGKPKGCCVSHTNLVRLLKNDNFPFDFNSNDQWILSHSYSFDFSVWEIFGCLTSGGTLHIPSQDTIRNIKEYVSTIASNKISVLNQTPALFYEVLDFMIDNKISLPDLKYIIFGGDKLVFHKLKPYFEQFETKAKLINMYGITETTIHTTYYEILPEDCVNDQSIIGLPLPETKVYILDKNLNKKPIGLPGEIFVGGTGVIKEYWKRKELSASRFIIVNDQMLYRSGDEAYLREDGKLIYLKRLDSQVQLRGFRVELGEIEKKIIEHKAIQNAIVRCVTKNNNQQLIAYYLSKDKNIIDSVEQDLRNVLPYYMIPTLWIHMSSFPKTAHGKYDFDKFPSFNQVKELITPQTTTEIILAQIWRDVLDQPNIFCETNFFEAGGHSLLATKLISKISQSLQTTITLKDLYSNPTLHALAKCIDTAEIKYEEQESLDELLDDMDWFEEEEV